MLNICDRSPLAIHKIHRTKFVYSSSWKRPLILWIQLAQASPSLIHLCPSWPCKDLGRPARTFRHWSCCQWLCPGDLRLSLRRASLTGTIITWVLLELSLPEGQAWRYLWEALLTSKANSTLFIPWLIKQSTSLSFSESEMKTICNLGKESATYTPVK